MHACMYVMYACMYVMYSVLCTEALQKAKNELNTIIPFEIINPKQLTDKLKGETLVL